MAYNIIVEFVETSIFSKQIQSLLDDDSYRSLQCYLAFRPDAGNVVQGSGGLRKIRWRKSSCGKRGEIRIIYHHIASKRVFLMLYAYRKNELEDLTKPQLRRLAALVQEEF